MNLFDLFVGVITVLTFILALFPSTLEEVRKVDPYRLTAFCIFGICILYWVYSAIQRFGLIKGLMRTKKGTRIIRDPRDPQGFTYVVEKDKCFHIPDPETFNYLGSYLGFSWKDLEDISTDDFRSKFTIGRQLPSIRPFCQPMGLIEKKE
jgi:hypothetical protein